jgi:hypothetical protein
LALCNIKVRNELEITSTGRVGGKIETASPLIAEGVIAAKRGVKREVNSGKVIHS